MSENIQNNQNRCIICNKKLKLMAIASGKCRCGGLYCSVHLGSKQHNCTFNYLEHSQTIIQKNNPIVIPTKV